MGDKMGQKVFPNAPGSAPVPGGAPAPAQQIGINFGVGIGGNAQALLAQQNSNMEALERRRERSGSMGGVSCRAARSSFLFFSCRLQCTLVASGHHSHHSSSKRALMKMTLQVDQESNQISISHLTHTIPSDESDWISTRTLALARYKRNHDSMNEVFFHAAFGDKTKPPQPSPYSIFKKSDLEEKVVSLWKLQVICCYDLILCLHRRSLHRRLKS